MNKGVENVSISELQESQTDIAFNFFISVLIIVIFIFFIGSFILAKSYFSMTIKQLFILFQEKIETKLLLGISIPYIVCEFCVEVFSYFPFYFLFTVMIANILGMEIIKELVEMFPIKEYFVNNSLFGYFQIQLLLFFGVMLVFSLNYFPLKKMVARLDEAIR
ncbi:hypothetical protein [Pilibacter termitis]|nr:hypothetical protein [Pilibacter termitis]